MRPCKTCGAILEGDVYRGGSRHERKCSKATDSERKHFKKTGHWPKRKLKPLPAELPEAPPMGVSR